MPQVSSRWGMKCVGCSDRIPQGLEFQWAAEKGKAWCVYCAAHPKHDRRLSQDATPPAGALTGGHPAPPTSTVPLGSAGVAATASGSSVAPSGSVEDRLTHVPFTDFTLDPILLHIETATPDGRKLNASVKIPVNYPAEKVKAAVSAALLMIREAQFQMNGGHP